MLKSRNPTNLTKLTKLRLALFLDAFFEEKCLSLSSDSLGEKMSGVSGLPVVRASSALIGAFLSSILFAEALIEGGDTRQDLFLRQPQLQSGSDSDSGSIVVLRLSRISATAISFSVGELLEVAACSMCNLEFRNRFPW